MPGHQAEKIGRTGPRPGPAAGGSTATEADRLAAHRGDRDMTDPSAGP
jgi:hypothetical protein